MLDVELRGAKSDWVFFYLEEAFRCPAHVTDLRLLGIKRDPPLVTPRKVCTKGLVKLFTDIVRVFGGCPVRCVIGKLREALTVEIHAIMRARVGGVQDIQQIEKGTDSAALGNSRSQSKRRG